MDTRRSAFATLKPSCVRVSEIAVNLASGQSSLADLDSSLADVLAALDSVQRQGLAIDRKLADYVFFPLSSVFRERQRLPSRNVETALQCLSVLLSTGWSSALEGALAVQLLLMLTFVAGGPPNASPSSTQKPGDELQRLAFACQHLLFEALRKSGSDARKSLLESSNIPSLGHAVSVLLDNARETPSVDVQLAALDALYSLCQCIADRPVLASFIPGIVSTLSRILTPSTHQRQPYKALAKALDSLIYALKLVYADSSTFPLPVAVADSNGVKDVNIELGEAWLKASAAQIRMALTNVMRLRKHERREVRLGLQELCFMILEECTRSLAECTSLAIENLFILQQIDADSPITSRLAGLILPNPDLLEPLKSSLYDWLLSMPRLMLSNDDELKSRTMGQIATSFNMLASTDTDMSVIDGSLLGHLQDSTMAIAKDALSNPPPVDELVPLSDATVLELHASRSSDRGGFPSIFNYKTAQTATVGALTSLVHTIASSGNSGIIAQEALDQARVTTGSVQVTNAWLALNLIRRQSDMEDALDVSDILNFDMASGQDSIIEEDLYGFALDALTRAEWDDEDTAWQIQALALETLALRASSQQSEFRPDLVDALYPVVHHLGSSIPFLRRHATIALNSIAQSCAYSSAQTLLVENADYLVNAIGNKISAFDIEPQTPQVLRMLAKLCGPRLIGYLDDVVDAIFEALDCFHSYPSLVEVLFSALGAMVEESAKANVLQPDGDEDRPQPKPVHHLKAPVRHSNMSELMERLGRKRRNRQAETDKFVRLRQGLPEQTPQRPWSELRSKPDADGQDQDPDPPNDDKPPPLTKPYETTLRIATSIQYHVTSPAPSTRLSLLRVLLSAIPFLARHEDSFLPLINALWPVVAPRLRDNEVYIVCATLHIMAAFAVYAGDFMSSRFEKLWPELKRLWNIASHSSPMQPEEKGAHGSRRITASQATSVSSQDLASITSPLTAGKSLVQQVETLDINTSTGLLKPSISKNQGKDSAATSNDLLIPVSTTSSDPNLMEVSTSVRNSGAGSSQAQAPKYEATTIIHLRQALVALSTRLLTHVRLDATMRSDIEAWLLPIAISASEDTENGASSSTSLATRSWSLVSAEGKTGPEDVRQAIADTNPDLLWLAREQTLWRADAAGREQLWEERRQALSQRATSEADYLDWEFKETWARRQPGTGFGQVQWARMVFATS